MELTEREKDVIREALDDFVQAFERATRWNAPDGKAVRSGRVAIARDLYFRFSHELV